MGWVAVVNRAQADLNAKLDMASARKQEMSFFKSNPEYKDLPNVGTDTLVRFQSTPVVERRACPRDKACKDGLDATW